MTKHELWWSLAMMASGASFGTLMAEARLVIVVALSVVAVVSFEMARRAA